MIPDSIWMLAMVITGFTIIHYIIKYQGDE
jgi:hypothetical protein